MQTLNPGKLSCGAGGNQPFSATKNEWVIDKRILFWEAITVISLKIVCTVLTCLVLSKAVFAQEFSGETSITYGVSGYPWSQQTANTSISMRLDNGLIFQLDADATGYNRSILAGKGTYGQIAYTVSDKLRIGIFTGFEDWDFAGIESVQYVGSEVGFTLGKAYVDFDVGRMTIVGRPNSYVAKATARIPFTETWEGIGRITVIDRDDGEFRKTYQLAARYNIPSVGSSLTNNIFVQANAILIVDRVIGTTALQLTFGKSFGRQRKYTVRSGNSYLPTR